MNVLSTEQRHFIIDLWCQKSQTQAAIADLVGTTQGNISKILKQARRRDLKVPRRRVPTKGRSPRQSMMSISQLGSSMEPMDMDLLYDTEQWLVVVTCKDEADQAAFLEQMESQHRQCKAVMG